jgi:hypothetical protein
MNKYIRTILILISIVSLTQLETPAQTPPNYTGEGGDDARNEIALFLGLTTNKDATAATFGVDYQYRLSPPVGLGLVVNHAAGDIKSTLLAPALFLHLLSWELTLAPAVEFSDSETSFVFRAGLEYEIKLPYFSISPTINLDSERAGELSLVYGLSFGMEF